ncbi:MAG: DEAD/DEAH box helicase family protein [Polyangiaceae bacterium]
MDVLHLVDLSHPSRPHGTDDDVVRARDPRACRIVVCAVHDEGAPETPDGPGVGGKSSREYGASKFGPAREGRGNPDHRMVPSIEPPRESPGRSLAFASGTLVLRGHEGGSDSLPSPWAWDERSACHRAPASAYADVVRFLVRAKLPFEDRARKYTELPRGVRVQREPRPYQAEAFDAWTRAQGRGVVVLPTGAGKTHLAVMAIDAKRRSTLVVAPTLDLVRQWFDVLRTAFGTDVGIVGGGEFTVHDLTVTTYDSAYVHMENLGSRFGMIVFDECHHLPGASYALAARFSLAPYRLGLTATPERTDGRDADLEALVGPTVYRKDIVELSGAFLSDYATETIVVSLTPEERARYDEERAIYRAFLAKAGIRMSSPTGWSDFILRSTQSEEGLRAMAAYRKQREIAFAAPAKLEVVDELLRDHAGDRVLLFTDDNATALRISRRFLIPSITHQTKVRERSEILAGIEDGTYGAVVTSKVLNEGVDIPRANVAIVVSGSDSVREHVQRLGRILRKGEGKHALLYELVSEGTSEAYTSERRRDHSAYR